MRPTSRCSPRRQARLETGACRSSESGLSEEPTGEIPFPSTATPIRGVAAERQNEHETQHFAKFVAWTVRQPTESLDGGEAFNAVVRQLGIAPGTLEQLISLESEAGLRQVEVVHLTQDEKATIAFLTPKDLRFEGLNPFSGGRALGTIGCWEVADELRFTLLPGRWACGGITMC